MLVIGSGKRTALFVAALVVSAVRHYVAARVFTIYASVSPELMAIPWFTITESPRGWITLIVVVGLLGDLGLSRLYAEMVTTYSDVIDADASAGLVWPAFLLSGIVFVAFDSLLILGAAAGLFDMTRSLMDAIVLRKSDPGLYFLWIEVMARLPLIALQGSVVAAVVVRRLETTSWRACLVFAAPPAIGRVVPVAIGLALAT